MSYYSRENFWFGTIQHSEFIDCPLQGADSSPESWGTDFTLLNGTGWGIHSWASHKRYTYEWRESSSPAMAQKMKSYRDGTYGRGLLYFLDPTIYAGNILPSFWADPSMALGNEAPSLVYGVEPTAVATSGASTNGLPVTSARYVIPDVLTGTPSEADSLFVPIPDGFTLMLGAFYSATGSGGVYVYEVYSNGVVSSTPIPLSQLSADATNIVEPFGSGPTLRGVFLRVGKTSSATSSVTLTALIGRLIKNSDIPAFTNWQETARNRYTNPLFEDAGAIPAGGSQSSDWGSGGHSLYVPDDGSGGTDFITVASLTDQTAVVVARNAGQTVRLGADEVVSDGQSPARIYGTGDLELSTGWWDVLTVVDGYYDGLPFSGDTAPMPGEYDTRGTQWVGDPNESESIFLTRTMVSGSIARYEAIMKGPWIGGQGHSGCRFNGMPSYITNSPINGGRVGFAASFIEVNGRYS